MNDSQLLDLIAKGKDSKEYNQAASYIFYAYDTYVMKQLMFRFSISKEVAEERYCDAVTILLDNIMNGVEIKSIQNYLWAIAFYQTLNHVKKKKHTILPLTELSEQRVNPDEEQLQPDYIQLYNGIKEHLSPTCQTILEHSTQGYSDKEIAQLMNIPSEKISHIKVQRYRCWKQFRKIIQRHSKLRRTWNELFNT